MGNSEVEDNRKRSWAEETKERACAVGTSVFMRARYVWKCPANGAVALDLKTLFKRAVRAPAWEILLRKETLEKGLPFYAAHQNHYPNVTDWRLCKSLFFCFSGITLPDGCCLFILFKEFCIIQRACFVLEGERPADCWHGIIKQCLRMY